MTWKACSAFAKYKAKFQPKCNCYPCWSKWFNTHPGKTAALNTIMTTYGIDAAVAQYGLTYVVMFTKFKDKEMLKNDRDGITTD